MHPQPSHVFDLPEEQEHRILVTLAHQGAMPIDQFARFFDYSPAAAEEAVAQLVSRRYATCREFLADEPPWIWLTGRGARVSGTGLCHYSPTPGSLARLRAVNEVRLLLAKQAPHARWTGYRVLRGRKGAAAPLPRAVVEVDGERHAIEVRANNCNLPYFREMVESRLADYDAVVVFCPERIRAVHERLVRRHGWRRVVIRTFPGGN
jgi:hypothetical protein